MIDQANKLRQMLFRSSAASKNTYLGRSIAVCSGKGGVGKTNLAVNLALALGDLGFKTMLFDADLGFANANILMGINPKGTVYDILQGKTFEEVLYKFNQNTYLISGGTALPELIDTPYFFNQKIIEELLQIEQSVDFLLIDLGAGLSKSSLLYMLAAQEIIVVTTPEITSISDAYAVLKVLAKTKKRPIIHLVVNRIRKEREGQEVFLKLQNMSHKFLGMEIDLLGFIYEDYAVKEAVAKQMPFLISFPDSPASRQIRDMTSLLAGVEVKKQDGFISRLLKLIS
jgi:flagellar biosynthesis protein FlhG